MNGFKIPCVTKLYHLEHCYLRKEYNNLSSRKNKHSDNPDMFWRKKFMRL